MRFMVYVEDFQEWCVPSDMDDIGDVARLRITGGTPAASAVASPARAEADHAGAEGDAERVCEEAAAVTSDQSVVDHEAAAAAAEVGEAARMAAKERAERERLAAEEAEQARLAADEAERQRIAADAAKEARVAARKALGSVFWPRRLRVCKLLLNVLSRRGLLLKKKLSALLLREPSSSASLPKKLSGSG